MSQKRSVVSDIASEQVRTKVDLDTILIEEIGQFGKFQLRTIALVVILVIFASFHAEYVFTTARINARCLIPECDSSTPKYAPQWILSAVPSTNDGSFNDCLRFANVTVATNVSLGVCPATLFDQNILLQCDEYVYENTNTIVFDFNLACDEWRRSLIGLVRTFGTLIALPIAGYMSDRWGRRTTLTINAFNNGWIGLIRYWTNTYMGFMISQFLESIFGAGIFSCAYILVLELLGPKYRVIGATILSSAFAVGQVIMGLIAWAIPHWKAFTLALYIPQLFTIAYFWIIGESVRWYMSKGRYEESESLLKEVARVNGKELSQKSLDMLRQTAEEEKKNKASQKELNASEPLLIVQVFRHKKILIRCIVLPICWITTILTYYGLSINCVNMSGNAYLNYMAVSAVEIPGFWISLVLLSRVGRKPVLICGYWICAACQIGYIFMPEGLYGVSLAVYLIGKSSISAVVTAIYVYTAELPIGSIVAPLTPAIGATVWDHLPFGLFAGFALVSGALVFIIPETLGTKLPDTMEEAENIGANTYSS